MLPRVFAYAWESQLAIDMQQSDRDREKTIFRAYAERLSHQTSVNTCEDESTRLSRDEQLPEDMNRKRTPLQNWT